MNVRLLRKIRKRYYWYFRDDGFPVLLDHRRYDVNAIDERYLNFRYGPLRTEIPIKEYAMRILILEVAGQHMLDRLLYKRGVRKRNRLLANKSR